MEGRNPPPPASHPFPDNPDLRKFWGTPLSKGFFKFSAAIIAGWLTLVGINFYLTRNDTTLLGVDISGTPEQFKKRSDLIGKSSFIKLNNIPMQFKHERIFTKTPDGGDLRFDDGIEFITNIEPAANAKSDVF